MQQPCRLKGGTDLEVSSERQVEYRFMIKAAQRFYLINCIIRQCTAIHCGIQ